MKELHAPAERQMPPRVAALVDRLYPDYRDEDWHFRQLIARHLRPGSVVLDAGCGRDVANAKFLQSASCQVVGVDLDPRLVQNPKPKYRVRGRLEQLPLGDESTDLITCRYVIEHLVEPRRVLREFARVLRSDGKCILLTPNRWHYVTLISRLTPLGFHRWVNARRGVAKEDVFPTHYCMNTRAQLLAAARGARLKLVEIHMLETRPNYMLFSVPTFLLGMLYERVVNGISWLAGLRVNILAVFEKPREA